MGRSSLCRIINWSLLFVIYCPVQVYSTTTRSSTIEYAIETEFATLPPKLKFNQLPLSTEPATTTPASTPLAPTYRPHRMNCTPPAIEQFARPLMPPKWRRNGGLILNVIIALFSFFGLAILCRNYFVSSLYKICEELKLSPNVAGATFMAVGSSAPELATTVIGTFVAKDDIGVPGIMGGAVFNMMFVLAVCALCSRSVYHLNWWPFVRDCIFYSISILFVLFMISDNYISWHEASRMILLYAGYCLVLYFDTPLAKWVHSLKVPIKLTTKQKQSASDTYENVSDPNRSQSGETNTTLNQEPIAPPSPSHSDANSRECSVNVEDDTNQLTIDDSVQKTETVENVDVEYPRSQEIVNPLKKPVDGGLLATILWIIAYPIHLMCRSTIPDCRTEKYRNWYALSFFISLVWISFYAYVMVWEITIICTTIGIPDTVTGLAFAAAAVSVPDALNSIAVVKVGYGDMAVANLVGSNVFDLLICLGLPWFIQTAMIHPGGHVNIISKGLIYTTLSLLSTVIFVLLSVHLNGWKLDRRLGIILLIWYLLFVVVSSMYELNVFGSFNQMECATEY